MCPHTRFEIKVVCEDEPANKLNYFCYATTDGEKAQSSRWTITEPLDLICNLMIFRDWQRQNKNRAVITSKVCCQHWEANFYALSLWEFGNGPCYHFLPYLNDTADYSFKSSLIMYICSVNHNTKAQVVLWKRGSKSHNTGWKWTLPPLFFNKWR